MHYAQLTNNDHVICNFFYFDGNYWIAAINELVNGDFSDFYELTFNHIAHIKVYSGKSLEIKYVKCENIKNNCIVLENYELISGIIYLSLSMTKFVNIILCISMFLANICVILYKVVSLISN